LPYAGNSSTGAGSAGGFSVIAGELYVTTYPPADGNYTDPVTSQVTWTVVNIVVPPGMILNYAASASPLEVTDDGSGNPWYFYADDPTLSGSVTLQFQQLATAPSGTGVFVFLITALNPWPSVGTASNGSAYPYTAFL